MGCVQCKDKEAAKLTDDRETSLSHHSGYRYGSDPTPQHYPSFGVTTIPNYNNFHGAATQGVTVFGGVHTSSQSGTLRSRGGTGEICDLQEVQIFFFSVIMFIEFPIGLWNMKNVYRSTPVSIITFSFLRVAEKPSRNVIPQLIYLYILFFKLVSYHLLSIENKVQKELTVSVQ